MVAEQGDSGGELKGVSILILEDNPLIGYEIEDLFANAGADVVLVDTLPDALDALDHDPRLVVTDYLIEGSTSLPLIRQAHARDIPVVLITGYAIASDDVLTGYEPRIFTKPFNHHELLRHVIDTVRNGASPTRPGAL